MNESNNVDSDINGKEDDDDDDFWDFIIEARDFIENICMVRSYCV